MASKVDLTLLLLHESSELCQINHLRESFFGTGLLPYHHIPTQHNEGEFFRVEYLYRQAGREFVFLQDSTSTDDLIDEID